MDNKDYLEADYLINKSMIEATIDVYDSIDAIIYDTEISNVDTDIVNALHKLLNTTADEIVLLRSLIKAYEDTL